MGLDSKTRTGRYLKNTEIFFKWMVLVWFVVLGGIRRRRDRFDPRKVKRVLFVRHDKLGDMIISLPIFHNLKRLRPDIEIDVLCGKDNHMIVSHDPHISNLMYYRKEPLDDLKRILNMRARKYDAIVDMTFGESVTATILLSLIGPGAFKLGAGKDRLDQFFDATVAPDDVEGPHIIKTTASLLKLFGIGLDECNLIPRMYLVEEDEKKALEFLKPIRDRHHMVVGINLSAGRPARTWPIENYIKFLDVFRPEFPDAAIILSAAPNERGKMDEVLKAHSENIYKVPSGYSIREIAGFLKHIDFLLTPDTSIGHIASCVDLPSLAMYPGNMENFAVWKPFNPCVRAINSPDFYRIEYLPPEPVFESFRKVIENESKEPVQSRD